jgi:hypothetical protein
LEPPPRNSFARLAHKIATLKIQVVVVVEWEAQFYISAWSEKLVNCGSLCGCHASEMNVYPWS